MTWMILRGAAVAIDLCAPPPSTSQEARRMVETRRNSRCTVAVCRRLRHFDRYTNQQLRVF